MVCSSICSLRSNGPHQRFNRRSGRRLQVTTSGQYSECPQWVESGRSAECLEWVKSGHLYKRLQAFYGDVRRAPAAEAGDIEKGDGTGRPLSNLAVKQLSAGRSNPAPRRTVSDSAAAV
jgi:hypothetical protein